MNAKELMELEEFIHERVFNMCVFRPHPNNNALCEKCHDDFSRYTHNVAHVTTDPAAALQVLEKCAEKVGDAVRITRAKKHSRNWLVSSSEFGLCFEAETLPAAIALFAKKLFTPA